MGGSDNVFCFPSLSELNIFIHLCPPMTVFHSKCCYLLGWKWATDESCYFCRYYVRIFAANAKGKSNVVNLKVSTVKETSRLPLLPPEQSKRERERERVLPPPSLRYSGFYDGQDTLRYEGSHTKSPTRLEQTIFIILASLAGLAFLVVISLLLCKFQCQVLTVWGLVWPGAMWPPDNHNWNIYHLGFN